MPSDPSFHASHLSAPRPYSPSLRQYNNRSPGLSTGSATQTLTSTPRRSASPEPLVLRLRGAHSPQSESADEQPSTTRRRRPRIQWAEDVIDNEGLGRKKSKVCCIYHKPRAVGESSDESSSDSSSDSDSDDSESGFDAGRDGARPIGGGGAGKRGRAHRQGHNGTGDDACGHDHDHGHGHGHGHGLKKSKPARRPSPNDYERMPKYDVKPLAKQPGSAS